MKVKEFMDKVLASHMVWDSFQHCALTLEGRAEMEKLMNEVMERVEKKHAKRSGAAEEECGEDEEEESRARKRQKTTDVDAMILEKTMHYFDKQAALKRAMRMEMDLINSAETRLFKAGTVLNIEKTPEEIEAEQLLQAEISRLEQEVRTQELVIESRKEALQRATAESKRAREAQLAASQARKEAEAARKAQKSDATKRNAQAAQERFQAAKAACDAKRAVRIEAERVHKEAKKRKAELSKELKEVQPGSKKRKRGGGPRHIDNDMEVDESEWVGGVTLPEAADFSKVVGDELERLMVMSEAYGHAARFICGRATLLGIEQGMQEGVEVVVAELRKRLDHHASNNVHADLQQKATAMWEFVKTNLVHAVLVLVELGLIDVSSPARLKVSDPRIFCDHACLPHTP